MPPKRKRAPDADNASSTQKRRRSSRLQPHAPAPCPETASGIAHRLPPPPLPLTEENLHRWDSAHPSSSRIAPASSDNESRQSVDNEVKLAAHGVYVDTKRKPPIQLLAHCQRIFSAPRETSPSATQIADSASSAKELSEQAGIDLIGTLVLFKGEKQGGERFLSTQPKLNLNTRYLPNPDTFASRQSGPLSQAQPDTTNGYITCKAARTNKVPAPLSEDDEFTIMNDVLTSSLHFPFLTCQWKGYKGDQGMYHAMLQGARDGACIVNYLHELYTNAGQSPSVVDTCHFSITCDMETIKLWVHWRQEENGQAVHFMECIKKAFLDPIPGDSSMELLIGTRKMLRNILDYAMNERLASIKGAMVGLRDNLEAAQAARVSTKTTSKSLSRRSSTRLPSGKKAQPEAPQLAAPRKASSTNLRRKSQSGALPSPSRSTDPRHNGQPEARRRSARISSSTTASRPDKSSRTRRSDEGFSSN